jgi:hypothetical protein
MTFTRYEETSIDINNRKNKKLTDYNLFVKEKMPEIKKKYSNKERLKAIGNLWQIKKQDMKLTTYSNPKIFKCIQNTYPELSEIEKQKLLDNLLKVDIYWRT